MYDTVNFRLLQSEAVGVDFIEETAAYLEDVGEHIYEGSMWVTGSVGNLKVSMSRHQMKIKDGSLCKWYLGDNFQTLGRGDVQRAIEKLSDTLHVPMDKAAVTRFDVAQNFICKHPPTVYINHLGVLKYATRLQEPSGLYYHKTNGRLCFYDKIKEQKGNGEPIPELYRGRNVLRYEQRYSQRLSEQFKATVTGFLLYDEAFYIEVLNRWRDTYNSIQKINDVSPNLYFMNNKKHLYKMAVNLLVREFGGELSFIEKICEGQKMGIISKKQAFDLRQAVKDACKIREGLTVENDAIKELDKKINDAVKFYR